MEKLLFHHLQRKSVAFKDIVEFHYHFERIYPFQDSNVRVQTEYVQRVPET